MNKIIGKRVISKLGYNSIYHIMIELQPQPPKPYHLLSYLSVTHAGCSNEGLLDGVALLKHPLLLASHCPVTLNQKLDDFQMTSECSMDQSTLPILIQVIHLREGDREIYEQKLGLYSQCSHMS